MRLHSLRSFSAQFMAHALRTTDQSPKSPSISSTSDVEKWDPVEVKQEDVYVIDKLAEQRYVLLAYHHYTLLLTDFVTQAREAHRHPFRAHVDVHILAMLFR